MSVRTSQRRSAWIIAVCAVGVIGAACTPTPGPTPGTTPDQIASVVATAAERSASLKFTDPAAGSSPITSFEVSVNGDAAQALPADRIVTGLTEGVGHSFRVRACNASGCGLWSPDSNEVTPSAPASVPAAVTAVVAVAGNLSATLSFDAPADGGSPITSTEVLVNGGAAQPLAGNGVVTGLTNGTAYTFRVRACNAMGCGEISPPSNSITPRTVPSAPSVSSSVSGRTITWTWNVPAGNGSAVTSFAVRLDGTLVQGGLGTSFSRTFGYSESHTLSVTAANAAGTGPAGSRSATTVAAPPPPPTVSISWDSLAVGSSPYVITTIKNFPANASVTLRCRENTSFVFPAYTVSTYSGNYTYRKSNNQAVCYQQRGIPTYVSATVNGVTYNSNTIS